MKVPRNGVDYYKTVFLDPVQIGQIVRQIVFHDCTGNLHEAVCEAAVGIHFSEGV
jgi:hypothetical protein